MPPPPTPLTPPTLYIIDGYAQFFRAYHAIRTPMTSPVTKEPTNLTFGFVGMLLKLLRGGGKMGGPPLPEPAHLMVALDVGGDRGTFRSQIFADYKATRKEAPDDMGVQIDRCLALLGAVGVPTIGSPGFEADDVIATVVTDVRRRHPGVRVRIVSKDKDLKQLLCSPHGAGERGDLPDGAGGEGDGSGGGGVELYDVHTDLVYDCRTLKEETGLEPAQVIDMLALMGDTVDNVPGVEGVGPKTAAQLIVEYGDLDRLMARSSEIKGKRGENLRGAAAALPLSRELVSLRHDAPVDFDLARCDVRRLDLAALLPILRELGFNRYQDDVRALLGEPVGGGTGAPPVHAGGQRAAVAPPDAASRRTGGTPVPLAPSGFGGGGLFDQAPSSSDPAPIRRSEGGEYRAVTTRGDLAALVAELVAAPIFAVDTETTGLSPTTADLCGLSFSTSVGTGVYVPVRSPTPERHLDAATVLDALRPVLEDPTKPKSGHNLKFDLLVLRKAGVELRGVTTGFDSMVASYLIDPSRSSHSMDALAQALLGRMNIKITELIGTGKAQRTFDRVPLEQATEYAAEDADVSLRLREAMLPQLRAMGLEPLFQGLEMPLVPVLAELEWNGVRVDPAELERQRARLQTRIDELRRLIEAESMASLDRAFNPDSPKQLAEALFNKPDADPPGLGLKSLKKTKTGHSTDIEVLEKLAGDPAISTPIPRLIVEHRQLSRLVNTYLVSLAEEITPPPHPGSGRIHASFNQTVAATGRLSSSDPNLQNIPIRTEIGREIRKAFVPDPGPPPNVLVSADYSQIELRLLAHLSKDPAMIAAFEAGEDIHTAVAAKVFGVPLGSVTKQQRSSAKMVNFGIVYGVTAFGLARRLNMAGGDFSNRQAEQIIADYKRSFPGITTFLQECIDQATRQGYVETMLKRRRPIPDIESTNPSRRSLAERMAINSVVQGSAADMIKIAMVDLHARLMAAQAAPDDPLHGTRMLLQIHDELVFESPAARAEAARDVICRRMEAAMTLNVPLKVDASIGPNWFDQD